MFFMVNGFEGPEFEAMLKKYGGETIRVNLDGPSLYKKLYRVITGKQPPKNKSGEPNKIESIILDIIGSSRQYLIWKGINENNCVPPSSWKTIKQLPAKKHAKVYEVVDAYLASDSVSDFSPTEYSRFFTLSFLNARRKEEERQKKMPPLTFGNRVQSVSAKDIDELNNLGAKVRKGYAKRQKEEKENWDDFISTMRKKRKLEEEINRPENLAKVRFRGSSPEPTYR